MDTISASEFKATCLALLDKVNETGQSLLITKHGKVVAQLSPPPASVCGSNWLGCGAGTGIILGDITSPATDPDEWEALRD
jgi:prevent-host-death family protein